MSRSSFAVRRIMSDLKELNTDPSDQYWAEPREDDFFDWHFVLRGPPDTAFEGGLYHGRILLPPDYPLKPPNIMFLTPNGRFQIRKKICLSISAYHPEEWQPAWGIRTILEALISFFPTDGEGAVGALDWSARERKLLVPKSLTFFCPVCKKNNSELIPPLRCSTASSGGGNGGGAVGDQRKKSARKKKNKYAEQVAQMHFHRATGNVELHTKSERQAKERATEQEQQPETAEPTRKSESARSSRASSNDSDLRQRRNLPVQPEATSGRTATGASAGARANSPHASQPNPTTPPKRASSSTTATAQSPATSPPAGDSLLLWLAIGIGGFVLMILFRKLLRAYSLRLR